MGVALIMSLLLAPFLDPSGSGGHATELPQVGVVAHRGAGAGETFPDRPPENTLPALLWGWEQGAPWVECDVILSGDGVPVVTHDFSSKRISDKSINLDTSSLETIQKLDAGSWKGPQWSGLRIPTLSEALEVVPEGCGLVIEIKSGEESAVPVIKAIEASGVGLDRLMIISFNVDTLRACRKACKEIALLWLMSFEQRTVEDGAAHWWVSWRSGGGRGKRVEQLLNLEQLIDRAVRDEFDGLDTTAKQPGELAARMKAAGLLLGVWTVNDPSAALALVRSGVQEITTDDPPKIIRALHEAGIEVACWPRRQNQPGGPAD
ncbi:MAG: glycerophosphodiester phosphodiesterase family protein [Phycisphaerales bacterium]|nr:glycerophosphodiester phosphodiesterase family protein [Phycisphaerales bacterium]